MRYEYTYYSTSDPLIGLIFFTLFGILLLANAITLYSFAKDAGYDGIAWLAFIPFCGWILRFKMAGMSGWLILLFLIPFVNFIALILLIVAIYKSYERNSTGSAGGYFLLYLIGLEFVANSAARKKVRGYEVW